MSWKEQRIYKVEQTDRKWQRIVRNENWEGLHPAVDRNRLKKKKMKKHMACRSVLLSICHFATQIFFVEKFPANNFWVKIVLQLIGKTGPQLISNNLL